MIALSENGIRDLVNRKQNQNGYILQIIHIEAVDKHSYTVRISDGVGAVDSTFTKTAADDIRKDKILEKMIIQINNYEFDRSGEVETKVILINEAIVIKSKVKNIIGCPLDYTELKALDFQNPSGANKLIVEEEDPLLESQKEQFKNLLIKGTANFSFSFLAGLCAAYFVKKIVKVAAFVTGGFFFTLQIMAYNGLVTIHWHKFKPARIDFTKLLRIMSISSGGFGLGFYLGVKKEIRGLVHAFV